MQSRCTAPRSRWLRATVFWFSAARRCFDGVPRRYSACFAEGRFFVCSGCADAVSCLTCLVRNWNAPTTRAGCNSSYLGSRAHRKDARRRLERPSCKSGVWRTDGCPHRSPRVGRGAPLPKTELRGEPAQFKIVHRPPANARPIRQAHPRELPEDVLGRRRATTHQQLPRWCGNAAQIS